MRWLRCLFALLLAGSLATPGLAMQPASARGGVLDLNHPGGTMESHALAGEWGFAWGRFVDPAGTEPMPGVAPVPGWWNDVPGKPPGGDGFGSYSLLVNCPEGQQLALSVPAERTAMRLYVNGRLVVTQGDPGRTPEEARPAIGRRAVLTDPFPCPLRVVAHVSNWSHRTGGLVRAPLAGPIERLAPDNRQRVALDTVLLGASVVLGVSPLFFFLVRRKERAPLLFGLFCLAQTVYADMNGERLLLQLHGAGETPWELFLKLEYFAWFGSMGLYALLVDQLFPRALHARAVRGAVAACLFAALLVATTPGRVYSHIVPYGQAFGAALGVYIAWAMARATYQRRKDTVVILAGLGFLLLVIATNLLAFHGELTQRAVTAFGLLAFVLSPAVVLLRRLARALNVEEQRSAEQREKVDLLVRATHAGILDWHYTRNLTHYSPRLLEIMGWPPDTDTSQWDFFAHVHPEHRRHVQEVFLGQLRDLSVRGGEMKHEPEEYRLLRQDGSAVWVHAEAISLRAPDGRTLRYICSFLDITDHRALAENLQRQNAALAENARLREDVERMSRHDLKTPLNSIIGVARLLREDAAVPPEHQELLAIAERAGYRMLEMVNLSLDLSRMELGTYAWRPQAVNLVDVVGRVMLDLQGLAQAAQVQVRTERPYAAPVYARAEELLCYSILANLVKNAIEATPPGGAVGIAIEAGEPVQVRVRNPGQVPASVAQRFFDKYVTAGKSGGTGLGTYSARLMARVQKGDLHMRTGSAGTELTLTLRALGAEQLPPAPARPRAAARPRGLAAAGFAPRRVLLVDDDEYNRLLLMRFLPSPPFTVDAAANGQAATEAAARHWPDIVLIDMEMPVMNGLETVQWLRARERQQGRRPCQVVMMSSNDDAPSIRRGLEAGSDRFLTKPFTREALLATLQELDAGGARPPVQVPPAPAAEAHGDEAPASPGAVVRVDPELLPEVPAFLESRRRMVEAMAGALAEGDREQLRTVAHRAAGGLALFGFHWAAWQSRGISARAARGEPGALREDIERLREHLQAVRVE